ncbi:unnamed protein product [Coregonus sp. 'balchen']|nr:unnamed protein product [Coregonus sp. 'balchen']
MVNLSTMEHSNRRPPHCWPPVAPFLLLLFIFTQQLYALIVSHGQLVSSTEAIISPFNFCLQGPDVGVTCDDQHNNMAATAGVLVDILRVLVIMSLYIPLVLVPFALMAFLFAVCCDDRGLLWFSVSCQAASSLLMLVGLCVFVGLHLSYVSFAGMTAGYYVCVCVNAELATAAVLTWMTGRRQLRDEKTTN